MGPASIVLLVIGAVLFVVGMGAALRLRRRGGAPVMSPPWLGCVVLTSAGAAIAVVSLTSTLL
ncbi:hypothetical protein [Frigoribacterium sp. 2355]